jgi:cytochrome oxidase assembly protein ShyY1
MTDAASKTPRIAAPPTGTVQVSGRVYPSEPGKRAAGLPRGQVDRLDVPAIAGTLGRPTYGGYVELTGSTPAQHGLSSLPGPDLSNPAGGAYELQHLAYVFQWFIFAIIALLAPYILMRIETRRGNDGGGPERPEIAAPVANHST